MSEKYRKDRNRTRMAGDVFKGEKWSKKNPKGVGPLTGDEKFKREKGYDKNLSNNGFREEFVEDMYKDKQIDYYSDHPKYDKMIDRTSRKTGLNFNKVNSPQEAEISNLIGMTLVCFTEVKGQTQKTLKQ